jgi:hypothetical protein
MSSLELIQGSCADQNVDAVVNAANRNLSQVEEYVELSLTKQDTMNLLKAVKNIQLH